MSWPTATEFQQSVQDPQRAFTDPELGSAATEINRLTGLPLSWSGAFAVVFKIRVQGGHRAVRCFTSNLPRQKKRYDAVSKYFGTRGMPPEFGEFEYQNDGILVNGNRHPILKMVWFDGTPLGKYVDDQINDSQAMKALAAAWLETAKSLQDMEIAHNDLQHGNIIVQGSGTNPTIKIVDYDGIFIPDFAGEKSPETGLPHYQHPQRDETHYDREIDNFPALVIYTSLLALSQQPGLIYTKKSNEALLFTKEDFQDPSHSKLFQDLCNTPDRELNQAANALQTSAMGPVGAVPRLSALAAGPTAQTQGAKRKVPTWATQPNAGQAPPPPGQAPPATSPNTTSIGGVAQQNRNEIDIALQELGKQLNPVVYRYAQQAIQAGTWSINTIGGNTGSHFRSLVAVQNSVDSQAMLAILRSILISCKQERLLPVNLIRKPEKVRNEWAHTLTDFSDQAYVQRSLNTLKEIQRAVNNLPRDLPAATPSQGGQQAQTPQQGNHPSQNAIPQQGPGATPAPANRPAPAPTPAPTNRPPQIWSNNMVAVARTAIAGALATAFILTVTSQTDVARPWLMALFAISIPATMISFLALCHMAGWQQALEQTLRQLPWALNTAADLIVRTTSRIATTTRQLWNQLPSDRARIIAVGSLIAAAMIGILWYNVQSSSGQGNMETAQNSAAAEAVQAAPATLPAPSVGPTSETAPTAQAVPTYLPVIVANTEGGTVPNTTSVPESEPNGMTTPPLDLQVHAYPPLNFTIAYPKGWAAKDVLTLIDTDGEGRLEIRAPNFDPAWSVQEFIDQVKEDETLTPGMGLKWKQYLEESAMSGNIGGIEFVDVHFAGQITPGGCLQGGTTRWLPSRYLPDLTTWGFSISISVCEEDLEEYEETMKQVLNSFVESNHDFDIQRELQRRAAEATTEESPTPDTEP